MAQFPQLNDSQNNLLAKIAANTGESQPRVGDGQHNLLFKIAQNTYASAVNNSVAQTALQPSGDGYVLVQQGDDLAAKYAEAKTKIIFGASSTQISVSGAGTSIVNGIYTKGVDKNGFNSWVKGNIEIFASQSFSPSFRQYYIKNTSNNDIYYSGPNEFIGVFPTSPIGTVFETNLIKASNPPPTISSVATPVNRATVFIIPGTYSLSSELAIDAECVDLVGLGAQFQSPTVIVSNNTLNVTANDVKVSGISVGTQTFKIGNNKPLQVFENCVGGDSSFATFTCSGSFYGCVGGNESFGNEAAGKYLHCLGGDGSFGLVGDLYGQVISCRLVGTGSQYNTPVGSGIIRFCLDGDNNIVNADAP